MLKDLLTCITLRNSKILQGYKATDETHDPCPRLLPRPLGYGPASGAHLPRLMQPKFITADPLKCDWVLIDS